MSGACKTDRQTATTMTTTTIRSELEGFCWLPAAPTVPLCHVKISFSTRRPHARAPARSVSADLLFFNTHRLPSGPERTGAVDGPAAEPSVGGAQAPLLIFTLVPGKT